MQLQTLALPGGQAARLGRGGGPVGLKAGGFLGRSRLRLRKPRPPDKKACQSQGLTTLKGFVRLRYNDGRPAKTGFAEDQLSPG
jgi:hypothetical protein